MLWFLQLDPKQLMVPMVSCQGLRGAGCGCALVPCRNSDCSLSCRDVLPTPLWVSSWGSESDTWEELLMVSPQHWEWGASYSSLVPFGRKSCKCQRKTKREKNERSYRIWLWNAPLHGGVWDSQISLTGWPSPIFTFKQAPEQLL